MRLFWAGGFRAGLLHCWRPSRKILSFDRRPIAQAGCDPASLRPSFPLAIDTGTCILLHLGPPGRFEKNREDRDHVCSRFHITNLVFRFFFGPIDVLPVLFCMWSKPSFQTGVEAEAAPSFYITASFEPSWAPARSETSNFRHRLRFCFWLHLQYLMRSQW